MADEPTVWLAACLPVDPTGLADLVEPGVAIPVPLVDDTLMQCQECGRDIWVGPRKKFQASLSAVRLLCYFCVASVFNDAPPGTVMPMVNLNPGRIERPRRSDG